MRASEYVFQAFAVGLFGNARYISLQQLDFVRLLRSSAMSTCAVCCMPWISAWLVTWGTIWQCRHIKYEFPLQILVRCFRKFGFLIPTCADCTPIYPDYIPAYAGYIHTYPGYNHTFSGYIPTSQGYIPTCLLHTQNKSQYAQATTHPYINKI